MQALVGLTAGLQILVQTDVTAVLHNTKPSLICRRNESQCDSSRDAVRTEMRGEISESEGGIVGEDRVVQKPDDVRHRPQLDDFDHPVGALLCRRKTIRSGKGLLAESEAGYLLSVDRHLMQLLVHAQGEQEAIVLVVLDVDDVALVEIWDAAVLVAAGLVLRRSQRLARTRERRTLGSR